MRAGRLQVAMACAWAVGVLAVASCSGGGSGSGPSGGLPTTAAPTTLVGPTQPLDPERSGIVEVHMQNLPEGTFYIEGFDVGLRFEDGDATVLASTIWTQHVESTKPDAEITDFYDTVLEQPVPAGTVVVWADVTIGGSGGPSLPRTTGRLPCRLPVEVRAGATVAVEVRFEEEPRCLRVIPQP